MMKMMKMKSVAEVLDLDESTIYNLIREGLFPQGYGDGRYRRWLSSEIEAYAIFFWQVKSVTPTNLAIDRLEEIEEMATNASKNRIDKAGSKRKSLEDIHSIRHRIGNQNINRRT
ncbi:helix-turn-helix transcriptional regulator [Suttonella ornithocola]|nr:helix-turn-helix domain-containing protein [Suttonella ornithocola]